jgi:hypothetical protein
MNSLVLALSLICAQLERDGIREQRNLLIRMNKNILSSSLGKAFQKTKLDFDVRLFVPKYPNLYKLAKTINFIPHKKHFIIVNLDLLAEQGVTKDLQFEVWPNCQGLVGLCYRDKIMMYDDNLEATNDCDYGLSKNQVFRTSDLKWSICCPILNERDEVVAILALDGKQKIYIDDSRVNALRDEVVAFSRLLYDSVPQLFKR